MLEQLRNVGATPKYRSLNSSFDSEDIHYYSGYLAVFALSALLFKWPDDCNEWRVVHHSGEPFMRSFLILTSAVAAIAATIIMDTTDANAVVCAAGVVRAGCAGPNGAVAVRRPVAVAPVVVRPVVVAPAVGCTIVNGVRVCR
jgi:hypothetical protein